MSDFSSELQPSIHVGRCWLFAGSVASLAFLFYGSLVPLNYEWRPFDDAWDAFLALASQPPSRLSRTDLAINFMLTVPLAFFGLGALSGQQRGARFWAWALVVLIVCLAASMSIEFAQHFFPGRTPSASDILMQSLGAIAGIAAWRIWGSRYWGRFFADASSREALTLTEKFLWLYLILLFGYNVMPLDLTLSPIEIYHKWTAGRINLIPFGFGYKGGADLAYGLASDIAIWVPAGLFRIFSGKNTPLQAWRWCIVAALVLELLQLFVFSRISDLTDIVTASIGSGLGIFAAARLGGTAVKQRTIKDSLQGSIVQHAWQGLGLYTLWAVVLAVIFWFPFDFTVDRALIRTKLSGLTGLPFHSYFQSTELRAISVALQKVLFFMPLGGSLAWAARSPRLHGFRGVLTFVALVLCGAVATGIELGQVLLPSHVADSGDLVFKTLGGMLGFWGTRAVLRRGSDGQTPSRFRRQRGDPA